MPCFSLSCAPDRRLLFAALAAFVVVGCGVSSAPIDHAEENAPEGRPPSGAGNAVAPDEGPPTAVTDDRSSPSLTFVLRGTKAPFAHADGLSGQTAKLQVAAIKSLWLLRSGGDGDPAPVKVFDRGDDAVPVDYASGQPVTLATVSRRSIPSGIYRRARVFVPWVRYRVSARLHANGVAVDGDYESVQALSEGARIDGAARARGFSRTTFLVGGAPLAAVTGTSPQVPSRATSGGVMLDVSGAEAFYEFDVDAAFDQAAPYDETVTFEGNVSGAFRWKDEATLGYQPGVFDTTPAGFEPVMTFGVNAYAVSFARTQP